MNARLKIEGAEKLIRQLQALASEKTAIKVQRQAANAAIRPMRQAVKSRCPVDEGGLKKSIDSSVRNRGEKVSAIVGSNPAVLESGKKAAEPGEGPRAARHLHLVIHGHVTPGGKLVPANDFLTAGFEASASQVKNIYLDKLAAGIEKAAGEAQ